MIWKDFLRTWEGVKTENVWLRGLIVSLLVVILALTAMLFRKDTIVTVTPFTLNEEAWVSGSDSSQSFKEAWGLALAQLMGNVTPVTVDFVKERIAPILSPRIYQQVMDTLTGQAQDIKRDRVTMRFEPKSVTYERSTNTVFVEGRSYASGAGSNERVSERTYEFGIEVQGHLPVLRHIETYQGRPRTEENKRKDEQRSSRKRNSDE